jgi:hydroxymethylglutaryl-CoA lyase
MNETIKIIECPRDAWQGLAAHIPTEIKAEYLRALIGAGFKHMDAVSFVSPNAVPQMADSEHVLEKLDPPDDVEIIGIVVNQKGAERAFATEAVRTLGFPYSLSPTFLERNQKQSMEEAIEVLEKIKVQADENALDVVVYISMAFGNPYGDLWNEEEVVEGVRLLSDMDIRTISLADTVGVSSAEQIAMIVKPVIAEFGDLEIGVHLHSRPEASVEKILAAYDAGCRRFDSAIGGLGGCPFAQDLLVGNIATERVLEALALRGETPAGLKPASFPVTMSAEIGSMYSEKKISH